jgi:hypothetical protein
MRQTDRQTHQRASNRTEALVQLRRDLHAIAMSVARLPSPWSSKRWGGGEEGH